MEVSMNTTTSLETSRANAGSGRDILQKTRQKTEESRETGQAGERPKPRQTSGTTDRRIDIYA